MRGRAEQPARRALPQWLQLGAVLAAALASVATSLPPHYLTKHFPAWRTFAPAQQLALGVHARVWISKSGREGLGVTLRLVSARGDAVVVGAALSLSAGGRVEARGVMTPVTLGPRAVSHAFVPLRFDNGRTFAQGRRTGDLRLTLTIAGVAQRPLVVSVAQYQLARLERQMTRGYPVIAAPPTCAPLDEPAATRRLGRLSLRARVDRSPDVVGHVVAILVRDEAPERAAVAPRVVRVEVAGASIDTKPAAHYYPAPPGQEGLLLVRVDAARGQPAARIALVLQSGGARLRWELACRPEAR